MAAGKPVQRYIPDDLDVRRQAKRAVDEIWSRRLDGRWDEHDDKYKDEFFVYLFFALFAFFVRSLRSKTILVLNLGEEERGGGKDWKREAAER